MTTREKVFTLMIDDDDDICQIVEMLLSEAPCYEFIFIPTLRSMRTAIPFLQRQNCKVDLILLDLTLHDSEDRDIVREIKAVSGDAVLIVVTGKEDDRGAGQYMRAGLINDYLVKGNFKGHEFRQRIRTAVATHHAKREFAPVNAVIGELKNKIQECERDPNLPPFRDSVTTGDPRTDTITEKKQ